MAEGKQRLTPEELAKSHDGLCAVALGDGICTCLVHWVEALQKEADQLKLQKRSFQIMSWKIVESQSFWEGWRNRLALGEFDRAAGDVECRICRLPYFEHPQLPERPTFHLVCDGRIVKT